MLEMFGPNVFIPGCISPPLCSGTAAYGTSPAASGLCLSVREKELEKVLWSSRRPECSFQYLGEPHKMGALIQSPTHSPHVKVSSTTCPWSPEPSQEHPLVEVSLLPFLMPRCPSGLCWPQSYLSQQLRSQKPYFPSVEEAPTVPNP